MNHNRGAQTISKVFDQSGPNQLVMLDTCDVHLDAHAVWELNGERHILWTIAGSKT